MKGAGANNDMDLKPLAQILLDGGYITRDDRERALVAKTEEEKNMLDALLSVGCVSETQVAQCIASTLEIPFDELKTVKFDPEALKLVPERFAQVNVIVPLKVSNGVLHAAAGDPTDVNMREELAEMTGMRVSFHVALRSDILGAIERAYRKLAV